MLNTIIRVLLINYIVHNVRLLIQTTEQLNILAGVTVPLKSAHSDLESGH